METIYANNGLLSERELGRIEDVLKEDGIIIIPTDTIYAIACDALNSKAVEKVCRLKGINPEKTNLSILCDNISMVSDYAKFDNYAFKLMKDNTPGPFTFLFRAASSLPRAFKGRKTVGIRIPANPLTLQIVKHMGSPLLSTSIEYQDEDYGINPGLISEAYEGKADLIVEGDDGSLIPSAIIDCTGNEPELIREGPEELKIK